MATKFLLYPCCTIALSGAVFLLGNEPGDGLGTLPEGIGEYVGPLVYTVSNPGDTHAGEEKTIENAKVIFAFQEPLITVDDGDPETMTHYYSPRVLEAADDDKGMMTVKVRAIMRDSATLEDEIIFTLQKSLVRLGGQNGVQYKGPVSWTGDQWVNEALVVFKPTASPITSGETLVVVFELKKREITSGEKIYKPTAMTMHDYKPNVLPNQFRSDTIISLGMKASTQEDPGERHMEFKLKNSADGMVRVAIAFLQANWA